jgi:hypothetical protein
MRAQRRQRRQQRVEQRGQRAKAAGQRRQQRDAAELRRQIREECRNARPRDAAYVRVARRSDREQRRARLPALMHQTCYNRVDRLGRPLALTVRHAMTQPEHRHAWMRQWHYAAIALAEVRRRELAQMSDADALAAAERVLDLWPITRPQAAGVSGLVEQQRLFQRSRQ